MHTPYGQSTVEGQGANAEHPACTPKHGQILGYHEWVMPPCRVEGNIWCLVLAYLSSQPVSPKGLLAFFR